MTREQVYEIIDSERDYQDEKWGPRHDIGNTVGDFIVYMDSYLRKAKDEYTSADKINGSLIELRKVIALGVACFQVFDAPKRITKND